MSLSSLPVSIQAKILSLLTTTTSSSHENNTADEFVSSSVGKVKLCNLWPSVMFIPHSYSLEIGKVIYNDLQSQGYAMVDDFLTPCQASQILMVFHFSFRCFFASG